MDTIDVIRIPVIETERLILRSFRESDLEPYYEMMADPDITRYLMSSEPLSHHDAWRSAATMAGHWMLHGFGQWAIEEKSSGKFIGRCGIIEPEGWPSKEVGWVLHKSAWGQGYATESAQAALNYAFSVMKLDTIISLIQSGNEPSVSVAERIGESFKERINLFGKEADVYQITAKDYYKQKVALRRKR
ncbi:GNAT family N-acetyltransferase [Kangiella shandongensis]|uniref:GNAT family N-acetyltransferase n=1 Tax=Kangiella shandongensis TaxID=2763258 RepID=UPI001CBB39D5|nr:GNAT family N-acetyltransferase [Kangiella shandongensis]